MIVTAHLNMLLYYGKGVLGIQYNAKLVGTQTKLWGHSVVACTLCRVTRGNKSVFRNIPTSSWSRCIMLNMHKTRTN